MRTAIYIRVSTTDQRLSVEAQEQNCLRYAALRELPEPHLYVDVGVSGTVPLHERAAGSELARDMAGGQVAAVVAVRLDRLFRDTADALSTLTRWDKKSAALHLLDMGGSAIDTSSPIGRFLLTMLAGMAEFERGLIAERTAAALARKRERGEYTGGDAPYGYRVVDGKLAPVAYERMIAQLVKGFRRGGLSFRTIATRLNALGYDNRGNPWRHDTVIRRAHRFTERATA